MLYPNLFLMAHGTFAVYEPAKVCIDSFFAFLLGGPAPIDRKSGSGHLSCCVAAQEQHKLGDILGGGELFRWLLRSHQVGGRFRKKNSFGRRLGRELFAHRWGQNKSWANQHEFVSRCSCRLACVS